jgi:hypothetical protein
VGRIEIDPWARCKVFSLQTLPACEPDDYPRGVFVNDKRHHRLNVLKLVLRWSVDIATATYSNSIGAPALSGYWQDPDFDPSEDAFYYVRVIEIPTPRWTTHDAAFYGIPLPESAPPTDQDRAYTSPIWYTP